MLYSSYSTKDQRPVLYSYQIGAVLLSQLHFSQKQQVNWTQKRWTTQQPVPQRLQESPFALGDRDRLTASRLGYT